MSDAEPAAPLVELRAASFSYDHRAIALAEVTATILPGEAHALIGPNGAGKSTLLKGLLGLIPAVDGELRVLGTTPRRAAGGVGYMPQSDELDPEFPVTLRQVVMMGRYRGIGPLRWPGRADRAAVTAALTRVGLLELADHHFGALSGGQQQRGMLARAIVASPRLLLLDEPFNGLDRPGRQALLELLRQLRREGIGVIVSTHDFQLATEACSHVLLLNRRQIAAGPISTTLSDQLLWQTFEDATADAESHGHLHRDHYHDTGFRPAATAGTGQDG